MEETVEVFGLGDRRCHLLFLISKLFLLGEKPACAGRQPMSSRLSSGRELTAVIRADPLGLPCFASRRRNAYGLGMASAPALFFGFESLMFVRKEA
ncbi:hypothetical protein ACLBWT_09075 [Paenibacillus sp. D51F]